MQSPKDQIKDKLSIVDVISAYIPVIAAGKNYKAKCPFHNEKTPSFFISPDRSTYYCFGCGEKGDIFSFVEKFEGTDFMGALKLLAGKAGVPLEFDSRNAHAKDDKERWLDIMEDATKFYESNLGNTPEARAYLLSRGLSHETISLFRIGFAKDEWRSVADYLIKKGYKKDDLEKVGLIKSKEGNNSEGGFYDRFRSRIMFPISDSSGRVIAFSGRIFGEKEHNKEIVEAKYINSPDTPLYNKANILFGIDKAKTAIRTRGYSIVVEGQMDLLMSHQASFTNTVAVSGTALPDLTLIRRLSQNIIFAYDGDEAGIRAASRSAKIALSLDMQVKIAVLPEGKDPADIIRENLDTWKDIIKNSVNIVTFHVDRICKKTNDIRMRGKFIKEIVFPFLAMVSSAIERSAYIHEIHSKTGIATDAIIEDLKVYEKNNIITEEIAKYPQEKNQEKSNTNNNTESRRTNLEKRLFGIVFWQARNMREMPESYREFKKNIGNEVFDAMYRQYEPFADTMAFEAETWYNSDITALIRDIPEIVLSLEEEILQERTISLLSEIHKKERAGDVEILIPILAEYQKVVQTIQDIKNKRSR